MGVHPVKHRIQQGFVPAGDAHGGGLSSGKHQSVECTADMLRSAALHDLNGQVQFVRCSAQGFRMFVAGALKHCQTHTEHGLGSMPFPISPTLEPSSCGRL